MSIQDTALEKITALAEKFSSNIQEKISKRKEEMENDDISHYLIYSILGFSEEEGKKTDLYQNIGRFLYKYAGSFTEEAALTCLLLKFPQAIKKTRIENQINKQPKTFEIDCLVGGNLAYEIKWRDATTDGDHISKEINRIKSIKKLGYIPIRIMFYIPNRVQSQRVQKRMKKLYEKEAGEYYAGDDAWKHFKEKTGVDLKEILKKILLQKEKESLC